MRARVSSPCARPREGGQASVELVAVLPFVLATVAVVWQMALAGHALWLCSNAARVAARAVAVGGDPEQAARSALPDQLERGLAVVGGKDGNVEVSFPLPMLLHGLRAPVRVSAGARLAAPPAERA
jgi:TadE-like protein